MTIIEELQTKLSETHDSVEKVLVDLNGYSHVKHSLQAANVGLEGASGKLDSLTDTLQLSTESFNQVTKSLGGLIEIIRSTDPAEVLREQKLIGESLERISEEIGQITTDGDSVKRRLAELPDNSQVNSKLEQLEKKLGVQNDSLRVQVDEKLERLSQLLEEKIEETRLAVTSSSTQTKKLVEGVAGKMPFVIAVLLANAALAIWVIKLQLA